MMKCKQCGAIIEERAEGVAYCPVCKCKRFIQPREIDPETGEWEGMTHGNF